MSLFLLAQRTNSPYNISCLCPFKLHGAPGREPRRRCLSSCQPRGQTALTAHTLPHASVPLSYLELSDEKLVGAVLFAGPADQQPIHYLMPLSLWATWSSQTRTSSTMSLFLPAQRTKRPSRSTRGASFRSASTCTRGIKKSGAIQAVCRIWTNQGTGILKKILFYFF